MVGFDKDKLGGIFRKKDDESEKEDALKKAKASATKSTAKKPASKAKSSSKMKFTPKDSDMKSGAKKSAKDIMDSPEMKAKVAKAKAEISKREQEEILRSKTHQDLINASYKAAEKLKTDPWLIMKNAGWSTLHEDRGKMYKGPILDEMEKLPDDQKQALKDELGIK